MSRENDDRVSVNSIEYIILKKSLNPTYLHKVMENWIAWID